MRRIERLSLTDDNGSSNEKGPAQMNCDIDEADSVNVMVQESLASCTLYRVIVCRYLSSTLQHKSALKCNIVEESSRNKGIEDFGLNAINDYQH